MEYRFKADLHGWLEYRSASIYTEIFEAKDTQAESLFFNPRVPKELLASLQSTLDYYHCSKEALRALHHVVFYAVLNYQNYATDFDAPRFEKGVDYHVLHHVACHFNLHHHTVQALASLPAKTAFDFLVMAHKQTKAPLRYLHKLFIRIVQRFDVINQLEFRSWFNEQFLFDHELESLPQHIELLLETLHHCTNQNKQLEKDPIHIESSNNRLHILLQDIISFAQKMESLYGISFITPTSSRLIDFMMPTEESMDCMPIISLPTLYCQSMRSREDLLEAWQDSNKAGSNLHQTAFMTICSHLKLKGLTSTRQTQPHHEFKALEDMLQQQAVDPLCQSKLYCCFALNHRSDNWLSLLKAMTQFIDLWIDDLEHSGCMNAYMALIVQQDLLSILFDKIHVHKCDVDLAKKICQLLKQCMDYGSLDQLLNLLDYAVSHQQTLDRMPAFDITDIWAFPYQSQLRKVCNQITLTEEDKEEGNMTIPLETLKVLTQLTIVWPWTTLKTLMELCLSNKNQYKAILPIFKTFKRILKDNLSFVNLLKVQMAIQMQSEYDSLQENTLQFINACCRSDHDSHIPTLLISENKAILLTVDQLIQTFVIPTLETCLTTSVPDTQLPLHSVRLCLALLCSLTESSQMDWTESVLDQSLREQTPCLFQSSISLLASLLTQLVDLRHKQTIVDYPIVRQLQLQDWELLVTFLERFVKLCSCAISQGQLDHIQHMIQTQGQQYTWQTQLFWLPIRPTLTHLPYPLSSLKIQEEKEILIEKEGWHVFFEACKLSTCMTDTLLIQGPFMPALCAHPFECSEILTGFQDVLYPQPLLTVASEYPKLMHYFLVRLYDVGGLYSTLRDYQGYHQTELIPIIQQLNHHDMKLFYIVLYTTQLLIQQATLVKDETLKSSNLYYMTHLMKGIQSLKHWSNISQRGQSPSYSSLRRTIKQSQSMPQAMSTRDLFEQEKLVNHSRLYHYPLLHHPDLVSERALSVLTLYHLSLVCIQLDYEANMQDIAKRLMLNISEGLIDMTSQQQFQRMLTQQPKSRVAGWKKKVKSGELGTVMKMRPCLVPEESYLLMPLLSQLKQMDDLVEALETKPISSPAAGILYFA